MLREGIGWCALVALVACAAEPEPFSTPARQTGGAGGAGVTAGGAPSLPPGAGGSTLPLETGGLPSTGTGGFTEFADASTGGGGASDSSTDREHDGDVDARAADSGADSSSTDGPVTPLDAADAGSSACGTSLGTTAPRASSFADCPGFGCDFGEGCDYTYYDLLCFPGDPCPPPPQTGDERCHRICDDSRCAPGERCEARPVYVSDTPAQYQMLCVCDGDAASCPTVAPASRGAEGGVAMWRSESPMPRDLYYHAAAASDRWLVVSGGLTIDTISGGGATLSREDRVSAVSIGADGVLGTWADVGTLPSTLLQHAMAMIGDRVYFVGGQEGTASGFSDHVRSAPIAADGTLGSLRDEANLPASRGWHALLTDGGLLYVAAGSLSAPYFTDGTPEIWVATPDAAGIVTGWSTVLAPGPVHYDGGAVIAGGALYVVGERGGISWKPLATLADSSSWQRAGPDPLGMHVDFASSGMHTLRAAALCDALFFLVPGGRAATVELAADGSLGSWHVASRVYGTGTGFGLAQSPSGRVYLTGGASGYVPVERIAGVWSTVR